MQLLRSMLIVFQISSILSWWDFVARFSQIILGLYKPDFLLRVLKSQKWLWYFGEANLFIIEKSQN